MNKLGIKDHQSPILWDNVVMGTCGDCIRWDFQFRAVAIDSKSAAIGGSPVIVAVQNASVTPQVTSDILFCNGIVT